MIQPGLSNLQPNLDLTFDPFDVFQGDPGLRITQTILYATRILLHSEQTMLFERCTTHIMLHSTCTTVLVLQSSVQIVVAGNF